MNSYLIVTKILISTFFIINSTRENSHLFNNRILIDIELNAEMNDGFGIPVASATTQLVSFCIKNKEVIFKKADDQIFTFSLMEDTLKFVCNGKPYQIKGQFFIPKQPEILFQEMFDPEDYSVIIRPYRLYKPIRTGEWEFETDTSSFTKVFSSKFVSKINDICE